MNEKDLTKGTPYKIIIRFAIPLLLGNLFQQFYNMADSFIISHYLGVNAFAGVSCTSAVGNVIIGFASGMTAGLAIPLAQSFGAGDYSVVRRRYLNNIYITILTSALLTGIGVSCTSVFLHILRTPDEIFGYAHDYLQLIYSGIIASMFYNFFANTLRALGDSRSPVHYLLISCGVNIVMDLLLVKVIPLGVRGAAIATVFSQAVSVVLCAIRIRRTVSVLSLKGEKLKPDKECITEGLHMGLPMAFQSSIISLGVIFVQFATNSMGTSAIAAYAAANKIDGIAVEPLRSLGLTMTTYTAQNFGAKKYSRILTGIKQEIFISLIMSSLLGVIMFTGGRALSSLFVGSGETEIQALSYQFLVVHGVLYFILALLFDLRYSLQGLGFSFIPTVAGLMELSMRTASAFLLIPATGFAGISVETPLSWLGALIPCAIAIIPQIKKLKRLAKEET